MKGLTMKCFLSLGFCLFCVTAAAAEIKIYPAPAGAVLSCDYSVSVDGKPIDIYAAMTRYGNNASFGYFDFEGAVSIEITANFCPPHSASFQIVPAKYKIAPRSIANGKIAFTLDKPAKLTIVVLGDYTGRVLHLFANSIEKNIPSSTDPNVIYFGPGYHKIPAEQKHTIQLTDGQTLYLAGGAFVEGMVAANKARHIKIAGRGILAQFNNIRTERSIHFIDCQDIDISGIILSRQYQGWSGCMTRSQDIRIHDYKVVSPAIWSTDGMNLANCSDVEYDDCFFRAGDDNIAIKGLSGRGSPRSGDPEAGLPNKDIAVRGCIFWSDNNNAVVLGQETMASRYENISFRDCDMLYVRDEEPVKAAMAIVCLHGTTMTNITFDDIRVGPSGQLITVFFTESIFRLRGNQTLPGEISNLTFRNITASGAGSKTIRLEGWNQDKQVKNVVLENVVIDGKKLTNNSPYLVKNEFVSDITIK